MYSLIEFNLISHVLLLKCHCIIVCSFFVELPSFLYYKPCQLVYESLLGHTLVQSNKHHSSTSIALVSVHHCRPST